MRSPSEPVKLLLDPKSGCWLSTECSLQTQTRRVSVASQQTPAIPLYPLLPTLAFSSSCFKISFTPKVQLSSTSHTFPPLLVPPGRSKYFDALTGNHPEHLGPGSSRRKLQLLCGRRERGSSLLCEDFSTHQALHCIDFFFFLDGPKGGERVREHSVILCRWPQ